MQSDFRRRGELFPTLPVAGRLETVEQIRNFELLRLASFVLKLKKLQQRQKNGQSKEDDEFRCNLLRHAIFYQIVTLTRLDAYNEAMQLVKTCRPG